MRAVLFANATATTSGGRRRRSPITHGSALVAFERSKLALAPLIRSRRKYGLPRAAGEIRERIHRGQLVAGRKRDDQIAMNHPRWGPDNDQATVRHARERHDGALDLAGIARV